MKDTLFIKPCMIYQFKKKMHVMHFHYVYFSRYLFLMHYKFILMYDYQYCSYELNNNIYKMFIFLQLLQVISLRPFFD